MGEVVAEPVPAPVGVEIRPAEPADLDALVEIYLDVAAHHAALDPVVYRVPEASAAAARLAKRVADRGDESEFVVAVVDGRIVGSASIQAEAIPSPGSMVRPVRYAELGIGILGRYRGLGIGQAMIAHLEVWAAAHAIERIILIVAEANEGAFRLYRRLGYIDSGGELRKELSPG
jgi:ribosomal protein S18 acetylase RimI-like enzyme